jgi:hypothetical protein
LRQALEERHPGFEDHVAREKSAKEEVTLVGHALPEGGHVVAER